MLLSLLLVASLGDCLPRPWIFNYNDPVEHRKENVVYPVHSGHMSIVVKKPRPLGPVAHFVSDKLLGGYQLLDRAVPQINTQNNGNYPLVFVRRPRHELSEATTTAFEGTNTTTTLTTVMEDKISKAENLEDLIARLQHAVEDIKNRESNANIMEPISESTSSEDLVKHITFSLDSLSKARSNATRAVVVQHLNLGLNILLNRVARAALQKQNATSFHKPVNSTELVVRIITRMREAEKLMLENKLKSGQELSSQEIDFEILQKLRNIRQQMDDQMNGLDADVTKDVEELSPVDFTTSKPNSVTAKQQDDQSSSEEGGGNLIANLISSFLGSLSKPDGGVDVDAIVGLISGLSVQRDDGSYDFSGLTDLLQSFFGGDGMGGGGSDVGAFLGGLLGAVLQGSANPPGAKGTGRLAGNLVANILPGLSGYPPLTSSEEEAGKMQPQGLDSGSFLAGLLTSMLGASSGTSSGSGAKMTTPKPDNGGHKGSDSTSFFVMIKNGIIKSIFSIVTSVLASSSSSSSGKGKH